MTVFQALAIAIWVSLVQGRFWGGAITLHWRFSPLITSLVCGIVLGDIPTAVITGATIQLITMGQVAPGGQMPTEPNIAAAIAVPLTIMSGLSPEAAVAVAVPVGILGGYLYQLKQFGNSFPLRYLEKVAYSGDERKLTFATFVVPQFVSLLVHGPIIFIALYFGADIVAGYVQGLEGGTFFHVLETVGGALGAVGIALLLRIIGRKEYIWFFFIAYFLRFMLAPLGISTVTWAVIGVLIAGVYALIVTEAKKA
ncbi:PTS mannose/fructose/sorbose/N-acetylgalactosamine transporter subunit IIC [Fundicoccus sp. Sow4_D5]|uniref:PTS mannose/fructose/sorbose/N-acetylgalactosamine transporter subunit IIC n=1 Tax=Fundicoccus sp. Sow4_D5 TaxID=3438782 RepID=UPI003F90AF69